MAKVRQKWLRWIGREESLDCPKNMLAFYETLQLVAASQVMDRQILGKFQQPCSNG